MSKNTRKTILKLLAWGVVLLVAYFFATALARDWENVRETLFSMSPVAWGSIVCFVAAVAVSGSLWARLVRQMSGKQVNMADAVRIHSASWLLKYVPGQVGSLVNKLAWAQGQGYSKKTIGTSVIYENVLMVFASMLLAIPALIVVGFGVLGDTTILLALLAVVPLLVICHKKVFYTILNTALRLAKRKPLADSELLSTSQIIVNTLYYMLPRILNGIGFVIIAAAMLPVTAEMMIPLASIFIFAGAIGMLALFVPSGLGVREGVIVLMASAYFPLDQVIVLALVARFFATVADIGVFFVYILLNKGRLVQR